MQEYSKFKNSGKKPEKNYIFMDIYGKFKIIFRNILLQLIEGILGVILGQ